MRKAKRQVADRRMGRDDSMISDSAEECSDSSSAPENTDALFGEKLVDTPEELEESFTPNHLPKKHLMDNNTCRLKRDRAATVCFNQRKALSTRVANCI